MSDLSLEDIERILHEILIRTNYDFRDYDAIMIRRRLLWQIQINQLRDSEHLLEEIRSNSASMNKLVSSLFIHVTELFRNPGMFRSFREKVVPVLAKLPSVRIWIAGCSTGEEAYSLSILLNEAGILDNCRIYATDIRNAILMKAREGRVAPGKLESYSSNYIQSGGCKDLSEFIELKGDNYCLRQRLLDKIIFARHNLADNEPFQDFDVICCRNVMIYFNQEFKTRVHRLLFDSLKKDGFLVLGDKETVKFTGNESRYNRVDKQEKIFRKMTT